jgi:hypothetical protein
VQITGPRNRIVDRAAASLRAAGLIDTDDGATAAADVTICVECAAVPEGRAVLLLSLSPAARVAPFISTGIEHPVLRAVLADGLPLIPVAGVPQLRDGAVLVRAGGNPVVIVEERDGRRIVELRADVERSPLARDAAFPLLMANILDWLSSANQMPPALTIGEPARLSLPPDVDPQSVVVTGPDGETPGFTLAGGGISLTGAMIPGIYRITHNRGELPVAVNPAIEGESNLRRATPSRTPVEASGVSPTSRPVRDITAPVLMLAAALLFTEWRMRHSRRVPRSVA